MKPEFIVVETHYENMTAYRVVKVEPSGRPLTTVHVYNSKKTAEDIVNILNDKLGA